MKASKIISVLFVCSIFTLAACGGSGDDSDKKKTITSFDVGKITGDKGSYFEITKDGKTETCSFNNIIGWLKGQLLGSSYFRQVQVVCNGTYYKLQVSIPNDVTFEDMAEGKHDLHPSRILLQDTGSLDEVAFEFNYHNPSESVVDENAVGTIELRRDVAALDATYSLVGEVDASFSNNGNVIGVKGQFWNKNTDW